MRNWQSQLAMLMAHGGAWTPASATGEGGAYPVSWYKADAIVGLSDGAAIDTWPDSGPNGHNGTQTGSARPIYKTGIINGLPVVRLASGQWFTIPNQTVGASWSHFAVLKTAAANTLMHTYGQTGGVGYPYLFWQYSDSKVYCYTTDGYYTFPATGGVHQWSNGRKSTGPTVWARKDGGALTTTPAGSGTGTVLTTIGKTGASNWSAGDIGETLWYSSAMSDADVAQVEAYLKAKWATP